MGDENVIEKRSNGGPMALALLATLVVLYVGCASSTGGGKPRPGPAATGSAATGSATRVTTPAQIRSLELKEEGRAAFLELVADRALVWTNYRDSTGNLVIELPNSVPGETIEPRYLGSGESLVSSVEITRLDDAERPLTRLLVRTREDSEHSLTTEGETLRLQLLPVGFEEPVALAYEPVPAEEPEELPAVRQPPGHGTAEAPRTGPPPSGVAASRLAVVTVLSAGDPTVIRIDGDGEFAYSTFRLENPERFVIDLDGVVNTSSRNAVQVGSEHVDQIRIGQFKPHPDPVSRVVFDLNRFAIPGIERGPDGLTVTFGTEPGVTTLAQDIGAEAMPPAEPEPEPVAEPPTPAPPAPAAPAPEPQIAELEAEPEIVEPAAMEPAAAVTEPEAETIAEQPVVTEPDVVEFPAPEPAVAEPQIAEFDAGEPAPAAPAATAPAAVAPAEVPASEVPVPASETPLPPPSVPVFEPTPEPIPTGEALSVAGEVRPEPPAAAQPSVSRPVGTSDVALFEAQQVQVVPPVDEQEEALLARFENIVVNRRVREYVGEPISMSLRNADLVETLRSFSKIADLNFVIQPGVAGAVTVELKNVPWDQAMEQILRIHNLGMDIDGSIVRIAPASQLRLEAEEERQIRRARQETIPLRTIVKSLSYATASDVSQLLRSRTGAILSARGTVQIEQRTNTLIIRELPDNLDIVLSVIENLDTPPPQGTIEARIIEATKTFARTLGIQWGYTAVADQEHGNTTGLQFPNNLETDGGVGLLTGGANGFLNLSMGNILNTFNLDARLQVAENEGLVNIISAPSVTTLNNTPATIQSGLQIPIQTVSNRTVSVQFVNATLQLAVTPQVTAEGTIILTINVAKRSPQLAFAIVGASNAPIATKEAQTTVIVRDGGTAVIGGIYEVSSNQKMDRVPGLANIPILGHLFKNRSRNEDNDEMMIFVTPRIVQM
ncbi:MAG: type IV pilus secretin PilQ [bacterium]|nr:type IV pilus secretin PilQ [bacterium]